MIKKKKHSHKIVDPPRFPKVINGFENSAKKKFKVELGKMIVDITKQMVKQKKKQ